MVGSNRVVQGKGIVYPLGDAEISNADETALSRDIVEQALDALSTELYETE